MTPYRRTTPEQKRLLAEMTTAGLPDEKIACVLGWKTQRVRSQRYYFRELPRKCPIGLPGGVLIDEDDAKMVLVCRWHLTRGGYVAGKPGTRTNTLLHRFILGAAPGLQVDHINGNPLDNRRANLRLCDRFTNAQNRQNGDKRSTTGVRGVSYDKRKGKFRAVVWAYGKQNHLGHFDSIEAAARVASDYRRDHMPGAVEPAKVKLVVP
jgi:hypothetical protein